MSARMFRCLKLRSNKTIILNVKGTQVFDKSYWSKYTIELSYKQNNRKRERESHPKKIF